MTTLTFAKLISSGAIIECVGTSGGHDLTSVWEIHFPEDQKTILFSYWIGDKSYRYANSFNELLKGEVSLDSNNLLLLSKEMLDETDIWDRIDYISENEISKPTANWNFESLANAKIEAVKYLKDKFE